MSIQRLDELTLPFDEEAILGSKQDLRDYIRKLITVLNEFVFDVVERNNLQIDISDATVRYYGTKDQNGQYPDGTWRDIRLGSGNNTYMERQKKVSNDWVKITKDSQ